MNKNLTKDTDMSYFDEIGRVFSDDFLGKYRTQPYRIRGHIENYVLYRVSLVNKRHEKTVAFLGFTIFGFTQLILLLWSLLYYWVLTKY